MEQKLPATRDECRNVYGYSVAELFQKEHDDEKCWCQKEHSRTYTCRSDWDNEKRDYIKLKLEDFVLEKFKSNQQIRYHYVQIPDKIFSKIYNFTNIHIMNFIRVSKEIQGNFTITFRYMDLEKNTRRNDTFIVKV